MMPSEPNVSRILLRVEMSDGQVREFVARDPHRVELTIAHPDPFIPDVTASPVYITAGGAHRVEIALEASRSHRQPITISTDDGGERCTRCGSASAFWHPGHREAV